MRDRKVKEILIKLIEKAAELNQGGRVKEASGVNTAIIIIEQEVKILENRKQEKFLKNIIREENTESYREDLYG